MLEQTIMEREGTKCKIGNATIQVPSDTSALSILSMNKAIDKAVFAKDGWVYVDKIRVKKWHVMLGENNVRVWEPKLDDVSTLEIKYVNVRRKAEKFWHEKYVPAMNALIKANGAHAKPTHAKEENCRDGETWWLYTIHEYVNESPSIGFDWVKEPRKKKNLDIGQEYYEVERKYFRMCGYVAKFRNVLDLAIIRFLNKHVDKEENKLMEIEINKKIYLYICQRERYATVIKKLAWPEDKVEKITIA